MNLKYRYNRSPALARGIICHLAIFEFGYLGSEVGKHLYHGSSGVSLAAKRGEKYLKAERAVRKQITDTIEKEQAVHLASVGFVRNERP